MTRLDFCTIDPAWLTILETTGADQSAFINIR